MKRVHFPPDSDLEDVQNCPLLSSESNKSQNNSLNIIDSSSHLCGKFLSPFRVGGRGAKLLSKVVMTTPSQCQASVDNYRHSTTSGSMSASSETELPVLGFSFVFCFEEPMCYGLVVSGHRDASQCSIIQPLRPAPGSANNAHDAGFDPRRGSWSRSEDRYPSTNSYYVLCSDGHLRTVLKEKLLPVEMKPVVVSPVLSPRAPGDISSPHRERVSPHGHGHRIFNPPLLGSSAYPRERLDIAGMSSSLTQTVSGVSCAGGVLKMKADPLSTTSGPASAAASAWQICWTSELATAIEQLCLRHSSADSTPNSALPNTSESADHLTSEQTSSSNNSASQLCIQQTALSPYNNVIKNINNNMRSLFASCPKHLFVPEELVETPKNQRQTYAHVKDVTAVTEELLDNPQRLGASSGYAATAAVLNVVSPAPPVLPEPHVMAREAVKMIVSSSVPVVCSPSDQSSWECVSAATDVSNSNNGDSSGNNNGQSSVRSFDSVYTDTSNSIVALLTKLRQRLNSRGYMTTPPSSSLSSDSVAGSNSACTTASAVTVIAESNDDSEYTAEYNLILPAGGTCHSDTADSAGTDTYCYDRLADIVLYSGGERTDNNNNNKNRNNNGEEFKSDESEQLLESTVTKQEKEEKDDERRQYASQQQRQREQQCSDCIRNDDDADSGSSNNYRKKRRLE